MLAKFFELGAPALLGASTDGFGEVGDEVDVQAGGVGVSSTKVTVAVPLPEPSGSPSSDQTIRAGGSTSRKVPELG